MSELVPHRALLPEARKITGNWNFFKIVQTKTCLISIPEEFVATAQCRHGVAVIHFPVCSVPPTHTHTCVPAGYVNQIRHLSVTQKDIVAAPLLPALPALV